MLPYLLLRRRRLPRRQQPNLNSPVGFPGSKPPSLRGQGFHERSRSRNEESDLVALGGVRYHDLVGDIADVGVDELDEGYGEGGTDELSGEEWPD